MSKSEQSRRAVAEIRWGDNPEGIAWVGSRSIHQFWSFLSPYFRDVLLTPQRRSGESVVVWSWREPADNSPPTASELAGLRKRLGSEQQSFADSLTRGGTKRDDPMNRVNAEKLGSVMAEVVAGLIAKGDGELASFVCRTETGLRLHSWGASSAANPTFPDSRHGEVSGVVLVGGQPASGHEVALENAKGTTLSRITSDAAGEFRFLKIASGAYRVRVLSTQPKFPADGLAITLGREPITGLKLRSIDDNKPLALASRARPDSSEIDRTWGRRSLAVLLLLLLIAGAVWGWKQWGAGKPSAPMARDDLASINVLRGEVAGAGTPVAQPDSRPEGEGSFAGSDDASASLPISGATNAARSTLRNVSNPSSSVLRTPPDAAAGESAVEKESDSPATARGAAPAQTGRAGGSRSPAPNSSLPGSSPTPTGTASPTGAPSATAAGTNAAASASANTAKPSPSQGMKPANAVGPTSASSPDESAQADASPSASVNPSSQKPVAGKTPAKPAGATADTDTAASKPSTPRKDKLPSTPEPNAPSADDAPAPDEKHQKTPAVAPGKKTPAATSAAAGTAASDSGADETPPDEPSAKSQKSAGKTRAHSPSNQPPGEDDEPPPPESNSTTVAPEKGRTAAGLGERRPGFLLPPAVRAVRVQTAAWRAKLLTDTILPTLPVPAGTSDHTDAMREKLMQERKAQLPAAFRKPAVASGWTLEIPSGEKSRQLRWRDAGGHEPNGARAQVNGNRAEIVWPGEPLTADGLEFLLLDGDGREFARIRAAQGGEATLRLADGVRAWFWIGVPEASADSAGADSEKADARFAWRLPSGPSVPRTWPQAHGWAGGKGHRLDIPLDPESASLTIHPLALVDAASGWALTGEIRQTAVFAAAALGGRRESSTKSDR